MWVYNCGMVRLISLGVLLVLIVFLGITFYQVIAPFLLPLFLAGVATILCQPVHERFLSRLPSRPRLAAGLTTGSVLAILLVPLLVGVLVATLQLYSVAQEAMASPEWDAQLDRVAELAVDWGLVEESRGTAEFGESDVTASVDGRGLKQNLADALRGLADRSAGMASRTLGRWVGSIIAAIVGVAMFGIALYYFLADGPALLAGASRLVPVRSDHQLQLLREFETVVRSVVSATLLASVAQGLLTAIALWLVGVAIGSDLLRHFFLFFILSTLASLVPITGAWMVWMPVAGWMAYNGHLGGAIVLTVFGVGVIGILDNVIRVHVLQSDTKLHPLLAFVSVLGGVHAMGLWGVFIGPIVACCLHALIGIFNTEIGRMSIEQIKEAVGDADSPADGPGDGPRDRPDDSPEDAHEDEPVAANDGTPTVSSELDAAGESDPSPAEGTADA